MISDVITKGLALCCILLIFSSNLFGQGQANNWVFGINLSMDFSTSPPTIIYKGQSAGNGGTSESTTSVSDASGNLLFASCGTTIFDNNYNAVYTSLPTTIDAAQGNLVIPIPGTTNKYYLTTVDAVTSGCCSSCITGSDRGHNYTVITVSGSTVTAGSVGPIQNLIPNNTTEMQAACPKSNGTDYWLVDHERGSNKFNVFSVTSGGITLSSPYNVGPSLTSCTYTSMLKFNPCYTKLAMAADGYVTLFDFDITNGQITNPLTWTVPGVYGLEFSSNNNYLFCSTDENATAPQILQWDISSAYPLNTGTTAAAISGTVSNLGTPNNLNNRCGHLEMGPDGNIYVAQFTSWGSGGTGTATFHLGRITNVNSKPASFDPNAIPINGTGTDATTYSLPTFLKSYVSNIASIDIGGVDISSTGQVCKDQSVTLNLKITGVPDGTVATWTIEGNSINTTTTNGVSSLSYPFHNIGNNIAINVSVNDNCGKTKTATGYVNVIPYLSATATPACNLPTNVSATGSGASSGLYNWYDTDGTTILKAGSANVTLPASYANKDIYVEPYIPQSTYTVGAPGDLGYNGSTSNNSTSFSAEAMIAITGFNINGSWADVNATSYTFRVRNGTTVVAGPVTVSNPGATNPMNFTGLYLAVPPGTGYTLEVTSGGAWFPINGTIVNQSGIISAISGGPFYNIKVAQIYPCVSKTKFNLSCCTKATINTQPTNQTVCSGSTATFTVAATGSTLGYQWQVDKGSGFNNVTASDGSGGTSSSFTTVATTTGMSTYKYQVIVTNNGTCPVTSSSVTLTVNAVPAAPTVTSPVTYCQNSTPAVLTASGTSLLWYSAASGGTGSSTAPTPSTATAGTTSYYVSQTVSSCESARAKIDVQVNATPSAPTVTSPVTYCQNATSSALTASGTSLLWYSAATGGTGSSTAPSPSTATTGTISYYVSQTVSGCESARAKIDVVVNATPAAPTVTSPVTYCQNATPAGLTATGASLLWYTAATGGTGSSSTPTPSTATAGTTSYYVTQTVSGCESARAKIDVVVNATPAAPTVTTPLTYCQNSTAPALTATGTSLLWYTASTGGTGSSTAPTPSTTAAGTTSYYVSQTVSGCESSRSQIDVTVKSKPTVTVAPASQTVCSGTAMTSATITLGAGGTGYIWSSTAIGATGNTTGPSTVNNPAGGNIQETLTATSASTSGLVTYTITPINGVDGNGNTCSGTAVQHPVTVEPQTIITSQTNTPIIQCEGGSFSLNVAATGLGTLSYQWYQDGNPISGATSSTYSVASSTAAQTGSYTVKVTSSATKCAAATSSSIPVTINAQPSITVQPSNQTTCAGGNVTLSLTANSAAPIFYQWQVLNGATWTDIPTATTNPFSYGPITSAANGAQLRAIVSSQASGAAGVCPVTSSAFTLTVNTNTSIGAFTADQTICAGSALTLSVSANGSAPFTYKWFKDGTPVQTTTSVSATSDTYTVASASAADAGTYTVEVTSGCGTVTTNPGSVVKVNSVTISTQPVDQTVCSNGNATFSVAATVGTGPVSYQWQLSTGGGAFADIGGATSSSLSLTGVTTAMSGNKYQVIIQDNGSCPKTSDAVTLTVNTATSITALSTDQSLCVGDNLSLSITAGGTAPYTFEWLRAATTVQINNNVATNSDTYTVGTVSAADAGSYTVKVTSACGTTTSSAVNVAVNGVTITGQPQSLTICGGNDATFTVAATGAGNGLSYQWQVKSGAGSFTDIAGATSASYTVTAASSAESGNQYQVIVKDNNSCPQTSTAASLTVNGAMTIDAFSTDKNLCLGDALNLSVSVTGTAPFTYDWYKGTTLVQSTTGATATTDTYSVPAVTATDKGAYKVIVTGSCVPTTSSIANIAVNGVTASAQPQSKSVCSGDALSFDITATAATGPLGYVWQVDDNTGGGFKDITGETTASLSLNADASQNGYKYQVIVNDNGACPLTSSVATLTVNANTTITSLSTDPSLCANAALNLSVTVSGTAPYSFVWKKDGNMVSSTTNTTSTTDTYSVASVSGADAGQYTVDVTSGCGTFTSNPINAVVKGVTITTQPVTQIVCENTNASFTVAATGISNPLSYQWQSDNGTGTYTDITGATLATLTLNNVAVTSNNYNYQVVINDNGGCPATSTAANLTVNPITKITGQPQGTTLCEPAPLNLSVTATGTGALQYEWFKNGASIQGPSSDDTYIVAVSTVNDGGTYTVKVSGGCGTAVTSSDAVVVVKAAADPNKTISLASICKNSAGTLTINNSQSSIPYTVYLQTGQAISDPTVGNGANKDVSLQTTTLAAGTYIVIVKAQGCDPTPVTLNNSATLTILDSPGDIAGSATVCKSANTGVSYSIGSVLGASSYNWAFTNPTDGTITAGQGTNSISVDLNTTSPVKLTVTPMTADNKTCDSKDITITQLNAYVPETIVADKDTICAGTTVTFSVPNGSEPTYIWTFVSDGSSQTTSSPSISKSFNNAGDVMVFVTTHGHPCHADTTLLLANPVHVVGFPVANAGPDQELTNYQAITLDGSGSSKGSDYMYTWTSSNGTIATPDAITTSAMPTELESSYTLTVAAKSPNLPRCTASDEVRVNIRLIVTIPNIFSPNGDHIHDVLLIQNIQFFPKSVLYVYNQWGELIYKSQGGYPTPWDGTRGGTECAIGAYYYVLELNENNYKPISGSITLVR